MKVVFQLSPAVFIIILLHLTILEPKLTFGVLQDLQQIQLGLGSWTITLVIYIGMVITMDTVFQFDV